MSLFTSVRPGEGTSVLYLFSSAFVLLAAYYLLKPVRESLILSEGSAEIRAYSVGIVALVLLFVIPLYKRLFTGLALAENKSRVLRWVSLFFISNLLIFCLIGNLGIPISVPFFVWLSIFNVMVLAQFWGFAADLYNTKSGQRLFVVIMVGASIGAWVGSQVAKQLFGFFGPYSIMLISAGLLLVPVWLSALAEKNVPEGSACHEKRSAAEKPPGFKALLGGFDVVFRSHYLLLLAALVFLLNMINTTGEFIVSLMVDQRAEAMLAMAGNTLSKAQLVGASYGEYFSWINLISLGLQLFVVSRLFRKFGVRGAILVLPVFMLLHYGALLIFPVFVAVRWLMIGENSILYSIQNTTNQTLYLPLSREQKYVGKTTIDTFFVRFGDLAQALMVYVGLNIAGLTVTGFIVINMVCALALIFVALDIRRSHKSQIKEKLSNLPPRIVTPLPNIQVPAGQLTMFSVPDDCFFDPDPGDTLDYSASLEDGSALPVWVRFDTYNQTFTVRPPVASDGQLRLHLTATDFEGLYASGVFALDYAPLSALNISPSEQG